MGEALAGAILITFGATLLGAYVVPQMIYRKTSGKNLLPLVPVLRILSLVIYPVIWALEFFQSLFRPSISTVSAFSILKY